MRRRRREDLDRRRRLGIRGQDCKLARICRVPSDGSSVPLLSNTRSAQVYAPKHLASSRFLSKGLSAPKCPPAIDLPQVKDRPTTIHNRSDPAPHFQLLLLTPQNEKNSQVPIARIPLAARRSQASPRHRAWFSERCEDCLRSSPVDDSGGSLGVGREELRGDVGVEGDGAERLRVRDLRRKERISSLFVVPAHLGRAENLRTAVTTAPSPADRSQSKHCPSSATLARSRSCPSVLQNLTSCTLPQFPKLPSRALIRAPPSSVHESRRTADELVATAILRGD